MGDNLIVKSGEDIRVSTVFLGLDHGFGAEEPVLFETMIFGGEYDEYCERYCTWDEAVEGHAKAVEMCGGIAVDGVITKIVEESVESRFDILDL